MQNLKTIHGIDTKRIQVGAHFLQELLKKARKRGACKPQDLEFFLDTGCVQTLDKQEARAKWYGPNSLQSLCLSSMLTKHETT